MNKWKAIAYFLFAVGLYWFIGCLFATYYLLIAASGPEAWMIWIVWIPVLTVPPVALWYLGYRSLRRSRIAPLPVVKPVVQPQAPLATGLHRETGGESSVSGILDLIVNDDSGVVLGYPMPDETLRKCGWHRFQSGYNYSDASERLVRNLGKLVQFGPEAIPLIEAKIQFVARSARSRMLFVNAGLLCEAIGRIGGEEAYRVLQSLFTQFSNVYEYQYIRGGAALGLALLGDSRAVQLLREARTNPPKNMEAQYGWIRRNIDEALTKLGVEPPETWDRVAVQFVSDMRSGTPDLKKLAKALEKFSGEERGAAWNTIAQEYWNRGERIMAQRCWLEALHNNPSPNFVTPWTYVEFPPGSTKDITTVEKLRKELGPLAE